MSPSKALYRRCLSAASAAGIFFVVLSFLPAVGVGQEDGEGEELQPPELIEEVQAEYTEEAIEERIEGAVVLELEIGTDGSVDNVEVVERLGYGLDEAAVRAAEQFEFRPATVDGEPISVVLDFTVRFSLPTLPATFEGRVVDDQTGDAIPGAEVTVRYTGEEHDADERSATTGSDGSFRFEELAPGDWEVELQLDAYRDFATDVELLDGETLEVVYEVPAEDVNVTGEVLEAGTRTPLAAMEVQLVDADTVDVVRETYTGRGGTFEFRGVDPGAYLVWIADGDYVDASFELDVVEDQRTTGTYYVRAEDYGDLTVRTTEWRERSEVNRQTIGLRETRRMAGAGTDAVRVVENLPGVARQNYFAGQPVVRGAAPQDTSIFLEGDPIPLAFHLLGGPAVVNTEMISAVDFYPGNFSSRFGRATAGIIDLQTRSPRDDRFHGTVEADLFDTSVVVEGPVGDRWSFALSGSRSYHDLFLPAVFERLDTDIVVLPRYYDYQGWATYRSGSGNHKVELFVYGSDDTMEIIFPEGEPEGDTNVQTTRAGFDNSFHRLQGSWEWDAESVPLQTELMASLGLNSFGLEVADELFFDLDYYTNKLRYDTQLELTDDLTLHSGIDGQFGRVDYGFAIPAFDTGPDDGGPNIATGNSDDRSTWLIQPAVYSELDLRPIEDLTLTPGVRADYFSAIGEASISPRFSTRYGLSDELTLKGGVGMFTQPPQPGQAEPDFGNPGLTFERAYHYAVGGEWQPREFLELDTTLFFRDNRDLVSQTSAERIDEEGNREPLIYDNAGRGRAYGWELLLRHYPRKGFFGWISYTLSRSERIDRDTGEWVLFDQDQSHILTLVAGYELPWDFDLSGRFRLVSGNPQTPVVGAVFDADADTYRSRTGEPNSARATPFHQLDLRLEREFVFDTWLLSAYLDVSNVYNATNEEGRQYNFDYSDSAPVRGVPILPTLGIKAQF